jgi:hypothetical protein
MSVLHNVGEKIYWRFYNRAFNARLRQEQLREQEFDRRYGVETGGDTILTEIGLSAEAAQRGNNVYRSVWQDVFHRALRRVPIRHEDFTFVDYGSGKGKAMLMASDYPFREIIGVEYAEPLHACAVRNIATYRNDDQRCRNIRSICADALDFEPPADSPLLCFFFNPFDDETFRIVFATLAATARTSRRPVYLLYVNLRNVNERRAAFAHAKGFSEVARDRQFLILKNDV